MNSTLRMDSGLTKIYALASEKSIIYDDRVGAALGLLSRKYLESINETEVPPELKFMRSNKSERNPSTTVFRFPSRPVKSKKSNAPLFPRQAYSNLMANWIVTKLASELKWSRHQVEAALFMIGYRVR